MYRKQFIQGLCVTPAEVKAITGKGSPFFDSGREFLHRPTEPSITETSWQPPSPSARRSPSSSSPASLHSRSLSALISLPSVMLREEFYSCCQLIVHTHTHTYVCICKQRPQRTQASARMNVQVQTHTDTQTSTHINHTKACTQLRTLTAGIQSSAVSAHVASVSAFELIKWVHGVKTTWREASAERSFQELIVGLKGANKYLWQMCVFIVFCEKQMRKSIQSPL